MSQQESGRSIQEENIQWNAWSDHIRGEFPGVQWGSIFSEREAPGMGLFEIEPGAELPMHHHDPIEIYFVVSGDGKVEINQEPHPLRAGATVYIPSNASHVTLNTGDAPLRILYVFPNASFREIEYKFDE
ncbi:cupin domain-containing protein [Jiella marina]|uniref:cupin domain-containing protein n=1 Tax=Jiella sp. LLJ827 TaxID=2917712 RepID=UPI002100CB38|nr:cupin domain-containing protein [Jiella sp. LLJ827]MCQ0987855.1 cupin domain-containing protein [Jiella sp. LLJ827]